MRLLGNASAVMTADWTIRRGCLGRKLDGTIRMRISGENEQDLRKTFVDLKTHYPKNGPFDET